MTPSPVLPETGDHIPKFAHTSVISSLKPWWGQAPTPSLVRPHLDSQKWQSQAVADLVESDSIVYPKF